MRKRDRYTAVAGMAVSIPKERKNIFDLGFDEYNMRRIMHLTGVSSVSYAPAGMTAADYCTDAAARLLDELDFPRAQIDGIVFATPHPDYIYPGDCGIVQERLNLPKKCIAMDINHSCTGLIYAVFVGDMMIRAQQASNVLICCGDTASRYLHPKDRALRTVVGDGGTALLLTAEGKEKMDFSFLHDGSGLTFLYTPAGGARQPVCPGVTDQEVTDEDGSVRTMENEYMNGLEVMRFVMNEVPPLVDDVLAKKGWTKESVDAFAFHQANVFMVQSLARAMQLPQKNVLIDMAETGNIGGASIALALCNYAQRSLVNTDRIVMAGFGTGMSGAALALSCANTTFLPVREL